MSRAVNHLIYIRNAISEIRQWTLQGETEFKKNIVLIKATLYNLQTLAESTSLLPQAWKDEHPEVDWNGIKSFRNFLAHQYMEIDTDTVWDVVTRDLSNLEAAIEAIARDHFNE
ncbi:conserved hypothetical protein [Coleofasciculus chthonoplastes PCC 7420]|uniref:DUF86 domain-containing protein n=2 Tax=Coleofasciculus TaxID=669368 RepID=B4W342_9CYAN|nr:HepT-like ribonuclease domain-containing protein [Coleofasciculus chthonoplastes]EDX71356.1 conserved hypothetical protein [Coleofasciculus chthonoplastes PCC 7420]